MILTSAAGRTKVTNVYLCTTSSRSLGGTFQTSDWCASVPQCISTQLRASGVLWFQASFRLLKHLGRKKLPTHKLKTPKNCMEKPVFAVDDWKLFESKDIYSGEMWRDVESIDSPHKICGVLLQDILAPEAPESIPWIKAPSHCQAWKCFTLHMSSIVDSVCKTHIIIGYCINYFMSSFFEAYT